MYERWLRGQATDPRGVFLVAEREPSKIVGFLIGTIENSIPVYRVEQFGFVHDMWVQADYRHEGIGRQLMTLALEKFRALGIKQVRLETAGQNEAARNLFKSCGFRVSAIEMLTELS
jgi:ribosomal protein S18 acetylase RimI-like enzyme